MYFTSISSGYIMKTLMDLQQTTKPPEYFKNLMLCSTLSRTDHKTINRLLFTVTNKGRLEQLNFQLTAMSQFAYHFIK
jgi:hypothetical protein